MLHQPFRLVSIVIIACLLAACGFHLRGNTNQLFPANSSTVNNNEALENIYIYSKDTHGDFIRLLKRSLKTNGITTTNSSKKANYHLIILKETNKERTITVTRSARTAEYELITEVQFGFNNHHKQVLIQQNTITAEKIYLADLSNIIAKSEEVKLLRQEMYRDLVRQIITQLQLTVGSLPSTNAG